MAVHWEQRTYGELDAAEQLKTFGAELVELETHALRHFGSEQAAEGRRRMDIKGGRPAMRAAALVLRDSAGPKQKPLPRDTAQIPRTVQPSVSLFSGIVRGSTPSMLPNYTQLNALSPFCRCMQLDGH